MQLPGHTMPMFLEAATASCGCGSAAGLYAAVRAREQANCNLTVVAAEN